MRKFKTIKHPSRIRFSIFIKYILLLLGFLFNFKSLAQILSLDSVLNRIEKNNPMLKMYDEQINAANNYSEGAKSWMPTTFSSGFWQTPYANISGGMWMITAQQMIPNPTKQKAGYNAMKSMASVEKYSKDAKKNEMFTMAKRNYYDWVVLKKKYEVAVQTDSILNFMLKLAQLRFKYNKEKLSSIYKAQADLFEIRNMQTMFLGEMRMKNTEINTLMACDKSFQFEVDTNFRALGYDGKLADSALISTLRSDIKGFDASISYLKRQQDLEKTKRLPDFGFSVTHMQSLGMMPSQFAAMGMVSIPLTSKASKEYKSNIKAIENVVNATGFQKENLINETMGRLSILQTQIKSSKKQLENYRTNIVPTYYKSYQVSMVAYEQNTEDLFLVLEGLKMYRMAKMAELNQLEILLNLQVDYEKEMEIK